jgi:uncharacterized phage protein (TIGR01671 family)
MSREIKFRAWDKKTERFQSGFHLTSDGKIIFACLVDNEDYILSQFTGLLDENGKEIFEGDIIKIKCNEDIIIGHVFYKQSRCCYVINHPAGYNGSFALHTLTIAICDEFNIIGNIYQHKNLLD